MGVVYLARQAKPGRLVALKMILSGARAGPVELARFKTEGEAVALQSVGADPSATEPEPRARRALADAAREYLRFTSTALPTAEAAARAGLSASRIRAMAAGHELLGVKVRGDLRFPLFQFDKDGLVRDIARVIRELDLDELHPVAVEQWFAIERPELAGLSVRDWLRTGRPLEPVQAMAHRAALIP